MTTSVQNRAIHSLINQIAGFDDEAYRAMLRDRFRVASSTELDDKAAGALILTLKGLAGQAGSRSPASTASGRYAPVLQALWLAAWNLGLVTSRDDRAMLRFAERQTGLAHTRFLRDHAEAVKAIEGLKGWISREGGVVWPREKDSIARKWAVLEAQQRLVRQYGASDFCAQTFGTRGGLPARLALYSPVQLDKLSAQLGEQIRAHKAVTKKAVLALV